VTDFAPTEDVDAMVMAEMAAPTTMAEFLAKWRQARGRSGIAFEGATDITPAEIKAMLVGKQ